MEADDTSIGDDWRLLRRVPASSPTIVWDGNSKEWVLSSAAFQGHPANRRYFSVHLEQVLINNGLGHDSIIPDPNEFALVSFTAGEARAQSQLIMRDPSTGDPAHAHVIGNKSKGVQRALRACAKWVIPPRLPPPADST